MDTVIVFGCCSFLDCSAPTPRTSKQKVHIHKVYIRLYHTNSPLRTSPPPPPHTPTHNSQAKKTVLYTLVVSLLASFFSRVRRVTVITKYDYYCQPELAGNISPAIGSPTTRLPFPSLPFALLCMRLRPQGSNITARRVLLTAFVFSSAACAFHSRFTLFLSFAPLYRNRPSKVSDPFPSPPPTHTHTSSNTAHQRPSSALC